MSGWACRAYRAAQSSARSESRISASSSVGITAAEMRLSGREMIGPWASLAASSGISPSQARPCITRRRSAAFVLADPGCKDEAVEPAEISGEARRCDAGSKRQKARSPSLGLPAHRSRRACACRC